MTPSLTTSTVLQQKRRPLCHGVFDDHITRSGRTADYLDCGLLIIVNHCHGYTTQGASGTIANNISWPDIYMSSSSSRLQVNLRSVPFSTLCSSGKTKTFWSSLDLRRRLDGGVWRGSEASQLQQTVLDWSRGTASPGDGRTSGFPDDILPSLQNTHQLFCKCGCWQRWRLLCVMCISFSNAVGRWYNSR